MVIDVRQITREEFNEFVAAKLQALKNGYTVAMKWLQEAIAWIQEIDYIVMEQHNPLTEEVIYYIEIKRNWSTRIWKSKNKVNQALFGCDRDGFFGNYQNALKIKKFISGETKIINRPAVKPKDEKR